MLKRKLESLTRRADGPAKEPVKLTEAEAVRRARVCIISFPKSGRTWLRVMIGKALCDRHGLDESLILDELAVTEAAGVLPTCYTHDGSGNTEGRHWRELKADKADYKEKKIILLLRDPRDIVVSCYFQATKRKGVYDGTISDFIRDDHYGIRKIVTFFNQWHAALGIPREVMIVTYEGLKADPAGNLSRVLAFIGSGDIGDDAIGRAVEFAGFDNMKRMESEGRFDSRKMRPGDAGDPESFKVRRGKVGGFVDYLGPDDQNYCDSVIRELGCPLFPIG